MIFMRFGEVHKVSTAKELEKILKQKELSPNLMETRWKTQDSKDDTYYEGTINTGCPCKTFHCHMQIAVPTYAKEM